MHPDKVTSTRKGPLFLAAVAKEHSDIMEIDLTSCDFVDDHMSS